MSEKSMRLMVPASTLSDAIDLINVGANDIYLGLESEWFNQYSFNGRAKISKNGKCILPSYKEFSQICNYVHKKGGYVYFLANTPMFNSGSKTFKMEFLDYVYQGITAGADYIILGDLYAIQLVKEKYPHIKVAASSYLEAQNIETVHMLKSMGVAQVVLSYQSELNEIKTICKEGNMDIEVFGHGGCSFYVGTCNMFHEMGEKVNIGYPCRAKYSVFLESQYFGETRILDGFKMCSLCKIKELISYNVHSLKIVGRDLPASYILEIVRVYSTVIHSCKKGEEIDLQQILPLWWKKTWCETGTLCRYGGQNVSNQG